MKRLAAPIISAILLLLPVLYVGSYLASVLPQGKVVSWPVVGSSLPGHTASYFTHYRWGYELPTSIYWPLEQIDRRIHPDTWEEPPPRFRT